MKTQWRRAGAAPAFGMDTEGLAGVMAWEVCVCLSCIPPAAPAAVACAVASILSALWEARNHGMRPTPPHPAPPPPPPPLHLLLLPPAALWDMTALSGRRCVRKRPTGSAPPPLPPPPQPTHELHHTHPSAHPPPHTPPPARPAPPSAPCPYTTATHLLPLPPAAAARGTPWRCGRRCVRPGSGPGGPTPRPEHSARGRTAGAAKGKQRRKIGNNQ